MALHLLQGGLGGETLVILEYAHAGGREAATALLQRKGVARTDLSPAPSPAWLIYKCTPITSLRTDVFDV